ncbi:MAG: hypothetical protein Q7R30_22940 [Acidobacteriota bacterium]|nr:hypothetical protein [Acidobacteriota bacterium]
MKRPSILHGMGLSALAFCLALLPTSLAAQQLGDNATIIVPSGTIKNLKQVLVVKSGLKPAATKVGNCGSGEVYFQDADLVDRAAPPGRGEQPPPFPTVVTTVAIVFPGSAGFKEFKPGWRVASYRSGGTCGPGFDVYVAHVIAVQ